MKIDWSEIEGKYGNRFISEGKYKTKVTKVTLKDATPSGSYPIEFEFEPVTEGKFCPATHWLTFKEGKDGWRMHHMKELMVVLGTTDEWAKNAVEKAEDAGSNEKIADAYEAALAKAATKNTELEVECWTETYTKKDGTQGTGARTEFMDGRVNMGHDKPAANDNAGVVDFGGSEDDIDMSNIPF